jgi:hypothetical protein
MTDADRGRLRRSCDTWVEIECYDGEVLVADLIHIATSTEEVLYDLVRSNRPQRYTDRWIGFHAYSLAFEEISAVRHVSE